MCPGGHGVRCERGVGLAWNRQACSLHPLRRILLIHHFFSSEEIKEEVFEEDVKGADAVFPVYFFSFGVGSTVVGDAHLVEPDLFYFGEFKGHLGFETEPVFGEMDLLDDLGAEDLVTGFHIREVEVAQHIGKKG
jgi:hypothetical protein